VGAGKNQRISSVRRAKTDFIHASRSATGREFDAVVIGSGPNGLAAAVTLAQAGCSVLVIEAKNKIGGGTRTDELTLPGFHHDVCSAVHPMGVGSPFFRSLPLAQFGLEWIYSPVEAAHPLDDGTAVLLHRSVEETAASLGVDHKAYRRMFAYLSKNALDIVKDMLGPLPLPPRHPIALSRFGLDALQPALSLASRRFRGEQARALFAGMASHSIQALNNPATSAVAVALMMLGHAVGWPVACGGSQAISLALHAYLTSLGGELITDWTVTSLQELPKARAYLFDLTPRQLLAIAGEQLPVSYQRALRSYRYGPGIFKVDYALDGPIPWKAEVCSRAITVHLGGSMEEIAGAESDVWQGRHALRPYVLLAQQSLFDPSRAPQGKHTLWAYCHVPHGSTVDMSEAIENQIERFAPGFRQHILARSTFNTVELETYNPNYIGGDIIGGIQDLRQLYTRPTISLSPYRTPLRGIYLCSSSTPPGAAVHGMCGHHAARVALRDLF
jgi:phytoene dehydrogenase-like protein